MKNLSLLLFFTASILFAQQEPLFTLYDNNFSLFNSGVTGFKHKVYVATNGRKQWANVYGGPSSITVNADLALRNNYGGFGIAYLYEEVGFETTNKGYLNYAYHIKKEKFRLGIGLGLNFRHTSLEGNFIAGVASDPDLIGLFGPYYYLALNPGVYFLHDKFEVGLGVTQVGLQVSDGLNKYTRPHIYLNGAYKFDTGEHLNWRISSLVRSDLTSTTAEIQAITTINKLFNVGLGARNSKAYSVIAGVTIREKLTIGYLYEYFSVGTQPSFEISTGRMISPTWHTHEVFISYTIPHN